MMRRIGTVLWAASAKDAALRDRLWKQKLKDKNFNPDRLDNFEREDLLDELVRSHELTVLGQGEVNVNQQAELEEYAQDEQSKRKEAQEMRRAEMLERGEAQRKERAARASQAQERMLNNQSRESHVEVNEDDEGRYRGGVVSPDDEFSGALDPKEKRKMHRQYLRDKDADP